VNELSKTFKSSDFIAIGITSSKIEDAEKYLMDSDIGFTQAQGNNEITDYFKVNSYPTYVLIDKKGFVRYIYYGYSEDIKDKIKSLI
jgi:thioredoxin-related protein